MDIPTGESSSEESTEHDTRPCGELGHIEPAWPPANLEINVNRTLFESHIRGHTFCSWEEFLRGTVRHSGQPLALQRRYHGSAIKPNAMQTFSLVATALIETCVWGLVGWAGATNIWMGVMTSTLYGVTLYLAAAWHFPPRLSVMIWPNVPCAIAAAGALLALAILQEEGGNDEPSPTVQAAWMLGLCILPQTLAAALWMLALPRDAGRASLVTNLFLGIYAAIEDLFVLVQSPPNMYDLNGNKWYYFSCGSLFVLGLAAVAMAWRLFCAPSTATSEGLVSWTLSVGCLALLVAVSSLLSIPWTNLPSEWCLFFLISPVFGVIGRYFGRSFPMLLSALSLCIVAIRACVEVSLQTGSPFFGFCMFGSLGTAVAVGTQLISSSQEKRSGRCLLA